MSHYLNDGADVVACSTEEADNKQFLEATLAEHRASQFALRHPFEMLARDFFRIRELHFATLTGRFQQFDLPQAHRAIRACFPEWRLIGESGPPDVRALAMPISQAFLVRPGRQRHFMTEGSQLFELGNGERRIIAFEVIDKIYGTRMQITLMGPHRERNKVAHEWSQLLRMIKHGRHYLRRQVITPTGAVLRRRPTMNWDDVVLEKRVRQLVIEHTIEFLRRRKQFRQNRIPQRRGIILHGPPGTGKTMIGKVLAARSNATFILVGTGDIDEPEGVSHLFEMARRLRPTIVFLEDIDFYGNAREHSRRPQVLGALLTELDGMESNDGVVVVATTNDVAALEPALVDRPSRFDVVLEIGLPRASERQQILTRALKAATVQPTALGYAASASEGASGAQLQEIAVLAVQRAIMDGRLCDDGSALVDADSLGRAIEHVLGRRRRVVGFGHVSGDNRGFRPPCATFVSQPTGKPEPE